MAINKVQRVIIYKVVLGFLFGRFNGLSLLAFFAKKSKKELKQTIQSLTHVANLKKEVIKNKRIDFLDLT